MVQSSAESTGVDEEITVEDDDDQGKAEEDSTNSEDDLEGYPNTSIAVVFEGDEEYAMLLAVNTIIKQLILFYFILDLQLCAAEVVIVWFLMKG